jgi:type I restriction enzyme S subunit
MSKYIPASKYCKKVFDGTHDSPKPVINGFPLITSKNILGGILNLSNSYNISESNYYAIQKRSKVSQWDILFSMIGSVGEIYLEKKSSIPYAIKNVGVFSCEDEYEAKWLYYYFKSPQSKQFIQNYLNGAVQKFLPLGTLRNFPVLPYNDKYKFSIDLLSAIDSKIELNNRINAELEAMAKTLYDYWFVQFDFPFDFAQGKPDVNGKPYKTSGGKMVWSEELKREIPEGWEVKLLGTEIEIQRGISYTSKEINGDGIPMISLNSFNLNGTYKPEGIKKYSGKYTEKNNTKTGDLLIAAADVTRNADIIGRAILVPDYYNGDLVFSMDIAKIISKNIPSSFLMMLFNSNHYHNYIKWYASGTIVLHLNLDGTKRYNIELPPKELLQKYDSLYQPIANRIYKTAIENQKLTELRDWLLPMLMNGQVKVN